MSQNSRAQPNHVSSSYSVSANNTLSGHFLDPFADEGAAPELILTPQGAAWAMVIHRLSMVYVASHYAKLDESGLKRMAAVWADEMPGVPVDVVHPLYKRTMAIYTGKFAPSLANFKEVWNEWEFWADANSNPDAKVPLERALPPSGSPDETPGIASYREQQKARSLLGYFVCCECHDPEDGMPRSAVLSPDRARWGCYYKLCDFVLPYEDTAKAPDRELLVLDKAKQQPHKPSDEEMKAKAAFAVAVEAALQCEFDLYTTPEDQRDAFIAWVPWYRQKYLSPFTRGALEDTWQSFMADYVNGLA